MSWIKSASLIAFLAGVSLVADDKAEKCGVFYTPVPPFYVTSVSDRSSEWMAGGKLYGSPAAISSELLRDEAKPKSDSRAKELGRGSLVRITGPKRVELAQHIEKGGKGVLIPVEVLKTEDSFRPYKKEKTYSNPGDKGLIYSRSLKKSDGKYVFVLKQNTRLYSAPGELKAGVALQPVQKEIEGKMRFKAWGCPPDETADPSRLTYFFEPFGAPELAGQEVEISQCLPPLQPVAKELHSELLDLQRMLKEKYGSEKGLQEFEVNDFGRVRLPVDENGVGPKGDFICYSPWKEECVPTWGKPHVVCSAMSLAGQWKKRCIDDLKLVAERATAIATQAQAELASYSGKTSRAQKKLEKAFNKAQKAAAIANERHSISDSICTLQIGDFGFVASGTRESGMSPLGHMTHDKGDCLDVRPIRNDGVVGGTNVKSPSYDRAMTANFVRFIKDAGANTVLFADPVLSPGVDEKEWAAGHKDHVHFCLDEVVAQDLCSAKN